MDESISKSSCKKDDGEIPTSTLHLDACPEAVVAETHSSRVQVSKPNPDAQDRNSKFKRPCEARRKKASAANRTTMESEGRTMSARLRNQELWAMFHREETEMIITKAGRSVFSFNFYVLRLETKWVYNNIPMAFVVCWWHDGARMDNFCFRDWLHRPFFNKSW